MVVATMGCSPSPSHGATMRVASNGPVSSPRSMRSVPSFNRIPTAHRSASGSRAITMSADTFFPNRNSSATASGSSGLGNSTVGNVGSGYCCRITGKIWANPADCNVCTMARPPTPCMAVTATLIFARSLLTRNKSAWLGITTLVTSSMKRRN